MREPKSETKESQSFSGPGQRHGIPYAATAKRDIGQLAGTGGQELPVEKELPFAGDYVVESPIIAVLTRFGLRRPWHLLQTYLAYRWLVTRVRRAAPGGLLKAVFLVENSKTCWSLSLWADKSASRWGGPV